MTEKLKAFHKLLKPETPNNIRPELKETFDSTNKALSNACEFALEQPLPGKKLVLMTNASFESAGCALMIEEKPLQKTQHTGKRTCRGVRIGNFLSAATQIVNLLGTRLWGKQGIPPVYTHFVRSTNTDNRPNR